MTARSRLMRPVLFLDVDGVLNSARWAEDGGGLYGCDVRSLDPAACARLERVLVATGCDLVLSSAWRKDGEEPSWFAAMLHERGCPSARFIGQTPDIAWRTTPAGVITDAGQRGDEIAAWLREHGGGRVFAIVDDASDMAHLGHRLVRTSWLTGLLDEHVERLVSLLTEAA